MISVFLAKIFFFYGIMALIKLKYPAKEIFFSMILFRLSTIVPKSTYWFIRDLNSFQIETNSS